MAWDGSGLVLCGSVYRKGRLNMIRIINSRGGRLSDAVITVLYIRVLIMYLLIQAPFQRELLSLSLSLSLSISLVWLQEDGRCKAVEVPLYHYTRTYTLRRIGRNEDNVSTVTIRSKYQSISRRRIAKGVLS